MRRQDAQGNTQSLVPHGPERCARCDRQSTWVRAGKWGRHASKARAMGRGMRMTMRCTVRGGTRSAQSSCLDYAGALSSSCLDNAGALSTDVVVVCIASDKHTNTLTAHSLAFPEPGWTVMLHVGHDHPMACSSLDQGCENCEQQAQRTTRTISSICTCTTQRTCHQLHLMFVCHCSHRAQPQGDV